MRTRKSAEARKAEIVDAALRLADKVGPERLTTDAIADAVGLTQPGVFRHFPKKQDLWLAVATRIGATMESRWAKAQSASAEPLDRIRALVSAQLRLIQSTPAIPAILFSRELHTKNKGLREAFFALLSRFQRLLADLAGQAISAGDLREELLADDVAYLVLGLVQGLAVRWSISGRGFDLVAEGERLLAVQLAGMLSDSCASNPRATS
ncbi:TetR/AcrR family transcriptional regulator [Seongchinamella unica]|uniref:TetR/AcrR family transcriptional regulator n=2 Tax=Seongchinamella TaxID=2919372 RepID=A0A4R5LTM6_9GAMM|nr:MULTISPECIES: TetR/AcrR family transcriptional regulator [Seongchinamella]RLQ20498.1 TetR family transcriptional regulator [Seongchinamella sediminis]TDG14713.1 TetR/AcrR family transcriptional regulator [Seongchinamella unica]